MGSDRHPNLSDRCFDFHLLYVLTAMRYKDLTKTIEETTLNANNAGFNQHGIPLHACNGYIQDEHYWQWVSAFNRANVHQLTQTPK